MGVCCCNIKLENIFLNENDNIYLIDFDLSSDCKYIKLNVLINGLFCMASERLLNIKKFVNLKWRYLVIDYNIDQYCMCAKSIVSYKYSKR